MKLLALFVFGLRCGPAPQIDVFAPIPPKGCPAGYYRVENAIFNGLNYRPACWSRRLTQIESVQSEIRYTEDAAQ